MRVEDRDGRVGETLAVAGDDRRHAPGRGGFVQHGILEVREIDRVGVRALLIHCESPRASDFYRLIDPGFEQSPTDPLHLLLLMADLRAAVELAAGMPAG
jgi:hypothetical protein